MSGSAMCERIGRLKRFLAPAVAEAIDPLPCPNPAERAVRLAVAMRDAMAALAETWLQRGYKIGFGVGIAQGFATLGQIGVEGRLDYTAVGTVINTAARLCEAAKNGQILHPYTQRRLPRPPAGHLPGHNLYFGAQANDYAEEHRAESLHRRDSSA